MVCLGAGDRLGVEGELELGRMRGGNRGKCNRWRGNVDWK